MVIIITILGAIYGEATAKQQIVDQMTEIVGKEGAELLATAIANLRQDARGGLLQLIFTIGFLIFGASGVFAQIQYALDNILPAKIKTNLKKLIQIDIIIKADLSVIDKSFILHKLNYKLTIKRFNLTRK